VQGKLLGQGRAQIGVVVGDQDLKSRGHEPFLEEAGLPPFKYQHGLKLVPAAARRRLA
jgi:hypothetical protein